MSLVPFHWKDRPVEWREVGPIGELRLEYLLQEGHAVQVFELRQMRLIDPPPERIHFYYVHVQEVPA